jgi:hypothetical protein
MASESFVILSSRKSESDVSRACLSFSILSETKGVGYRWVVKK